MICPTRTGSQIHVLTTNLMEFTLEFSDGTLFGELAWAVCVILFGSSLNLLARWLGLPADLIDGSPRFMW